MRTFDVLALDGGTPGIALALMMAHGRTGAKPMAAYLVTAAAATAEELELADWLRQQLPFPLRLALPVPHLGGLHHVDPLGQAVRRDFLGLATGQRTPRDLLANIAIARGADDKGEPPEPRVKWQRFAFPLAERGFTRADCSAWLAFMYPDRFPEIAP